MNKINHCVSAQLKRLRQAHKWSLDIASQKTGVSKAMLGQIERGESSPTLTTLWKIACGFQVPFSTFIENIDVFEQPILRRKGAPLSIHSGDDKFKFFPIFPYDPKLGFEVFIIELMPGCEHQSVAHEPGTIEHIVVTQGSIEVYLKEKWHYVTFNEGLKFNGDQAHGYRNLSEHTANIHNIIHYTTSTVSS